MKTYIGKLISLSSKDLKALEIIQSHLAARDCQASRSAAVRYAAHRVATDLIMVQAMVPARKPAAIAVATPAALPS